jgi:heavy metal efflux system protein
VWTRTGTAEVATDPMGLELSDVFVTLTDRGAWTRARTQAELVAAMRGRLSDMPGMRMVFTQPIEMRVNEMIAGARSDVVLKLFGDDLAVLRDKAAEIHEIVRTVAGSADSSVEQVTGQSVLRIQVDREALARHGIRAEEVTDLVRAVGPARVGDILVGERRVPLAVTLSDEYRQEPDLLTALPVRAEGSGSVVPLGDVASVKMVEGPSTIQREWGRRRILIQSNVRHRDVAGWVEEARQRVEREVDLPAGYFVRWSGQFEHLERARARLLIVVPLAVLLVFLLLYVTYGQMLDSLRVFTGVPFAAVGGVLALLLRGMPFSVSAGIGFIALSGVAVLADMVLVSTVRQLTRSGMPPIEAVRLAAERRLRPVLMTGLVAALGFLPMAVSTGVGAEVQRPLATVVIGGLLTSTLLTLVVLPVLYTTLAGRRGDAPAG